MFIMGIYPRNQQLIMLSLTNKEKFKKIQEYLNLLEY